MNKRTFVKNTAVMTACSLLLRLCGILFRIFISNRVGAEGMGLYQLAFSVYILGATFATSGLTTAVTRLAAGALARHDRPSVGRLLRLSALCCLLVGGASALLLYGGAPIIGRLIGDSRAVPAIAVSGIALPFIGVSSCLKGYFMARRRAWPPCLSQIIEQAIRIGGILLMLRTLWDGSLENACLLIILGDALSETVACLYLLFAYRLDVRREKALPAGHPHATLTTGLLRPLLHIAVPITAGRYLSTALRTVENFLVPARLTLFTGSDSLSLAQFGAVKGMALPLIFFPSALLMTLSNLLIPELSDAYELGQQRQVSRLVERSLHITLLGATAIGGLFTISGKILGQTLYNDSLVGLLLQILGPLTPVMYLDSVVSGMLKGLGQQVHSLWYSVADSAVRILLIWLLLPRFGLTGFLFVMLVSNLLTCLLSTHRLLTVSHTPFRWGKWLIGPVLCTVIAGSGQVLITHWLPLSGELWTLLVGGSSFLILYGILLPIFRCFAKQDFQEIIAKKA
ncbi:MAG: polysaccharide biosynthesis protein [Clostridia bacterium]|nr:polysaccharide biosynthesis protein [Clostridia bacterium]